MVREFLTLYFIQVAYYGAIASNIQIELDKIMSLEWEIDEDSQEILITIKVRHT